MYSFWLYKPHFLGHPLYLECWEGSVGVDDVVEEAAGGGLAALHDPESLQDYGPVGAPHPGHRLRGP